MVRELVAGDPSQSRVVPVRLGARPDKLDYVEGWCRARSKSGGQCGRRPRRGFVVCGQHGGGHAVRQRDGTRLSPQEAGRLSGLARRLKRDGHVDLAGFPALLPWLQERAQQLREQPAPLGLEEDIVQLTSLRDLVLSGRLDMEVEDVVRLVSVLVQVKAVALRAKQALQLPTMVPAERVQALIVSLVGMLQTYVPPEHQAQIRRELILLGASRAAVGAQQQDADGRAS